MHTELKGGFINSSNADEIKAMIFGGARYTQIEKFAGFSEQSDRREFQRQRLLIKKLVTRFCGKDIAEILAQNGLRTEFSRAKEIIYANKDAINSGLKHRPLYEILNNIGVSLSDFLVSRKKIGKNVLAKKLRWRDFEYFITTDEEVIFNDYLNGTNRRFFDECVSEKQLANSLFRGYFTERYGSKCYRFLESKNSANINFEKYMRIQRVISGKEELSKDWFLKVFSGMIPSRNYFDLYFEEGRPIEIKVCPERKIVKYKNRRKAFHNPRKKFKHKSYNELTELCYSVLGQRQKVQYYINLAKSLFLKETMYECAICNESEWTGFKLTLQLDHIDGDFRNNMKDNLRLLCPNCHSLTSTYKAKNIIKIKHQDKFKILSMIDKGFTLSEVCSSFGYDEVSKRVSFRIMEIIGPDAYESLCAQSDGESFD